MPACRQEGNMARHNEIGKIGEDIAAKWAVSRGMTLIERNYRRKWGEIDIVARLPAGQAGETSGKLHFIEVKSVSYETKSDLDWAVTHETYRPEDNVHKNKQDRLKRAIQTWILDKKYNGNFQIDIVTVRIVLDEEYARIHYLDNVIFE
jgi:putative endonuclease